MPTNNGAAPASQGEIAKHKRVFKMPVYLVFDDTKGDLAKPEASLHDIQSCLEQVIFIDFNTLEFGNPFGLELAVFEKEEIEELSPEVSASLVQQFEARGY